jgi:hypothetical protein
MELAYDILLAPVLWWVVGIMWARSGDRIAVRAGFSAPVQTGPWGPPSLLYNGYLVFLGGKAAGVCR